MTLPLCVQNDLIGTSYGSYVFYNMFSDTGMSDSRRFFRFVDFCDPFNGALLALYRNSDIFSDYIEAERGTRNSKFHVKNYEKHNLASDNEIPYDLLLSLFEEDRKTYEGERRSKVGNALCAFNWQSRSYSAHCSGPILDVLVVTEIPKSFKLRPMHFMEDSTILAESDTVVYQKFSGTITEISASKCAYGVEESPCIAVLMGSLGQLAIVRIRNSRGESSFYSLSTAMGGTRGMAIEILNVLKFNSSIVDFSWRREVSQLGEELAAVCEDGSIWVQGLHLSGIRLVREPTTLPLFPRGGLKAPSYIHSKNFYPHKPIANILFGSIQSTLLLVSADSIELIDYRNPKSRSRILWIIAGDDGDNVVDGLDDEKRIFVRKKPNPFPHRPIISDVPQIRLSKYEQVRCASAHPLNPFRFVVATTHRLLLMDERVSTPLLVIHHDLLRDQEYTVLHTYDPDCIQNVAIFRPEMTIGGLNFYRDKTCIALSTQETIEIYALDEAGSEADRASQVQNSSNLKNRIGSLIQKIVTNSHVVSVGDGSSLCTRFPPNPRLMGVGILLYWKPRDGEAKRVGGMAFLMGTWRAFGYPTFERCVVSEGTFDNRFRLKEGLGGGELVLMGDEEEARCNRGLFFNGVVMVLRVDDLGNLDAQFLNIEDWMLKGGNGGDALGMGSMAHEEDLKMRTMVMDERVIDQSLGLKDEMNDKGFEVDEMNDGVGFGVDEMNDEGFNWVYEVDWGRETLEESEELIPNYEGLFGDDLNLEGEMMRGTSLLLNEGGFEVERRCKNSNYEKLMEKGLMSIENEGDESWDNPRIYLPLEVTSRKRCRFGVPRCNERIGFNYGSMEYAIPKGYEDDGDVDDVSKYDILNFKAMFHILYGKSGAMTLDQYPIKGALGDTGENYELHPILSRLWSYALNGIDNRVKSSEIPPLIGRSGAFYPTRVELVDDYYFEFNPDRIPMDTVDHLWLKVSGTSYRGVLKKTIEFIWQRTVLSRCVAELYSLWESHCNARVERVGKYRGWWFDAVLKKMNQEGLIKTFVQDVVPRLESQAPSCSSDPFILDTKKLDFYIFYYRSDTLSLLMDRTRIPQKDHWGRDDLAKMKSLISKRVENEDDQVFMMLRASQTMNKAEDNAEKGPRNVKNYPRTRLQLMSYLRLKWDEKVGRAKSGARKSNDIENLILLLEGNDEELKDKRQVRESRTAYNHVYKFEVSTISKYFQDETIKFSYRKKIDDHWRYPVLGEDKTQSNSSVDYSEVDDLTYSIIRWISRRYNEKHGEQAAEAKPSRKETQK